MPAPSRGRRPRRPPRSRRRLPERDPYALALGALSRKERTEAELSAWLGERGVEGEELRAVLLALAEEGAIDDERFARRYAEDKRELRGWGPDRIAEALQARGVEHSLIEAAIADEDEGETVERALALLEGSGADAGDEVGRARALGLLARRGYPVDTAYEAVRALERRSEAV